MALPALATADDLTVRGIDTSNAALTEEMLAVASATVRGAAGSPILQTTSTVVHTGWRGQQALRLWGPPVRSVTAVELDGDPITDWRSAGESLWRRCGWSNDDGPADVEVTYTHGLTEVPRDIVNLVCSLAAAGMKAAEAGGIDHDPRVVAERVGDFSVTYAKGSEAVATVMDLPERTIRRLQGMFGSSAAVVKARLS